jgi:hypothetical protein
MSPSRIPRPGGVVCASPSPLPVSPAPGPVAGAWTGAGYNDVRSPIQGVRSAPGSPAITPSSNSIFRSGVNSNNPFNRSPAAYSQTHAHAQVQGQGSPLSPGAPQQQSRMPQPTPVKRRPKPPSEYEVGSPSQGQSQIQIQSQLQGRRPVPAGPMSIGSPESNGTARVVGIGSPIGGGGMGAGTGVGGIQMRSASNPRSCLRQPSTPMLSTIDRTAVPRPSGSASIDPSRPGRPRAATTTQKMTSTQPAHPQAYPTVGSGVNGHQGLSSSGSKPHLFEPSFAESREPSVPPHIRVRLRLIHQLGVVLGLDAAGISSKIDIPGLLARVDAAYDRGSAVGSVSISGSGSSAGSGGSGVSEGMTSSTTASSLLPLPLPRVEQPSTGTSAKGAKGGGVFGIIKRFGRKAQVEGEVAVSFSSANPTEGGCIGSE